MEPESSLVLPKDNPKSQNRGGRVSQRGCSDTTTLSGEEMLPREEGRGGHEGKGKILEGDDLVKVITSHA